MYISLTPSDLAWAFGLIAIAIALSVWQKIGLEWQIAQAAGRTLIQLIMVGYILAIVFDPRGRNPFLVLAIALIMITIATKVTRDRISQKIPRLGLLIWSSILASATLSVGYTNFFILQPEPWYEPQYFIPLTGMIIGNAMNGGAIAGERLVSMINSQGLAIETYLSLGATPAQAVANYRREAVRASLIPTLNSMMVIGLVTLPGMITGQLLSGVAPLDAASYQILLMFMIALANLMTSLLVTAGLCQKFFNTEAQLLKF